MFQVIEEINDCDSSGKYKTLSDCVFKFLDEKFPDCITEQINALECNPQSYLNRSYLVSFALSSGMCAQFLAVILFHIYVMGYPCPMTIEWVPASAGRDGAVVRQRGEGLRSYCPYPVDMWYVCSHTLSGDCIGLVITQEL